MSDCVCAYVIAHYNAPWDESSKISIAVVTTKGRIVTPLQQTTVGRKIADKAVADRDRFPVLESVVTVISMVSN